MDHTTPAQAHLEARIQVICDELMLDGRTFTACDISNKLKIEGFAVRHLDIAPKVRAYLQPLIDSGVSTQAGDYGYELVYPTTFYTPNGVYVYAPLGTDVRDYQFPRMFWTGRITDTDRHIEIGQILDIQPPAPAPTAVPVHVAGDANTERVKDIFVEELGIDRCWLFPSARLGDDLGVDELDLIELSIRAEEEFGIQIPEEDLKRFVTFGDVLAYASRRGKEDAPPAAEEEPGFLQSLVDLAEATVNNDEAAAEAAAINVTVALLRALPPQAQRLAFRNTRERISRQREECDQHDQLTDQMERRMFGRVITRKVEEPKPTPSITVTGFSGDNVICGDGRGMAWQPVQVTPTGQPTQVTLSTVPTVGLGKKVGRRVTESQGRVRIPGKMLKPGVTVFDVHFNGNETVIKPL